MLLAKSARCFTAPAESFCGNLRVEEGEECDAGLVGDDTDRDGCCDENCRLRRGAACSDKNSPCCTGCQFTAVGSLCRQADYATCEKEGFCTGASADCPPSRPMPEGTPCIEKGRCSGAAADGKCVPYCETRGRESCACDTEASACRRCCRARGSNTTCVAERPADILPDGTPCFQGFCSGGRCEKTSQVVYRAWDLVDGTWDLGTVLRFMKDNIVGLVVLASLLVWVPLSCLVSWMDRRVAEQDKEDREWRRQDELVHPGDGRRIVRVRVPRRNNGTSGEAEVVQRGAVSRRAEAM